MKNTYFDLVPPRISTIGDVIQSEALQCSAPRILRDMMSSAGVDLVLRNASEDRTRI